MEGMIPSQINDPTAFETAVVERIKKYVAQTDGRAFVLFTSYKLMQDLAERMQPFFDKLGLALFVQGTGTPRSTMLEKFKDDVDSVAGLGIRTVKECLEPGDLAMDKTGGFEGRFGALEGRFERLEARMDALEARMDGLEARMDRLEARLDRIEERMITMQSTTLRWMVGLWLASTLTTIGFMAAMMPPR